MSAELPRRSLAAQQVAAELCTLSKYNKHSSVDVASTLEVNNVKPVCYVIMLYLVDICYLLHECCISVSKCLYVSFSYSIIEG